MFQKDICEYFNEKLLVPGWAGELDKEEQDYIWKILKEDVHLRHKWGMKGKGMVTFSNICKIAMYGDIENPSENRRVIDGTSEFFKINNA